MIRNTQKINEAVGKVPSSIDELVPKLKQMQLDMKALEDKKVKSKSLRAQLAEATEKVEEVFATVVKAPCMILIPIFEALPSATDLKKDEKLVQFWEKVTCHLETADNFIAEKLTAFFDEMAQPESTLVWRSRRKLFADAIRFLRRSVSFFSWMCVHLVFLKTRFIMQLGFSEVVSFRVFQCSRKRMSLIKVYVLLFKRLPRNNGKCF